MFRLKLPNDMPKAYYHATIFDGGLGIVTLEHQVPLMKIRRIERLWASNDPEIREMLSTDGAESLLARQREPSAYSGVRIASRNILREALANGLHACVDGRACTKATSSHISINGSPTLRGNPLPSPVRAARGRQT